MFGFLKKEDPLFKEKICDISYEFDDASNILEFFKNETGIDFDKKRDIITFKLENFCKERGFYGFDSFFRNLTRDLALKQELIDFLSVNETYFYREMKEIESLVKRVKESASFYNILSIPSSSGEEPYTIAISLLEAGIGLDRFKIVAADINESVVKAAKKAEYSQRSLHRVPFEVKEKYFEKIDEKYRLVDKVKRSVDFRVLNIFDESFKSLGKFDHIFCRNMLIYFDDETKKRAVGILKGMLKESSSKISFGHADLPSNLEL